MDNVKTFQCPNCGSSVNANGADREVKCAYCGSTVIVPEELRKSSAPPQMNFPSIPQGNDEVLETISTVGKAAAGITVGVTAATVILPIALTCIILAAVGGILYFVFSNVNSLKASAFPTEIVAVLTQEPTDVPTLTPTPLSTPVPFTKVVLKDNFTNPSSGWEKSHNSNYTLEYKNGNYHVLINEQDKGQIVWIGDKYKDESIEVDVKQTAGPSDGRIGVACRAVDAGSLYSFEFSQDGFYGIYKYTKWNSDQLDGGTLDPNTLNQAGINHVEGICNGEDLTMLINGTVVSQVQDSEYALGGVGLVVRTGESGDPGIDTLFSNYLVKSP